MRNSGITLISRSNITKSQMDDLTTYALLATSFFFVAIAFGLLVRYRQASQRINASTDLGRDLWSSLELRLKKQDERILDMMGRLEVVQLRALATPSPFASASPPPPTPLMTPGEAKVSGVAKVRSVVHQTESQASQELPSLAGTRAELDASEVAVLALIKDGPKNTRQLTDSLKLSREHTARMMKELFERGLVVRDDSSKPFVYQLTEEGRRRLPS